MKRTLFRSLSLLGLVPALLLVPARTAFGLSGVVASADAEIQFDPLPDGVTLDATPSSFVLPVLTLGNADGDADSLTSPFGDGGFHIESFFFGGTEGGGAAQGFSGASYGFLLTNMSDEATSVTFHIAYDLFADRTPSVGPLDFAAATFTLDGVFPVSFGDAASVDVGTPESGESGKVGEFTIDLSAHEARSIAFSVSTSGLATSAVPGPAAAASFALMALRRRKRA